ncbi:MAG: O-antigen ligase family protein [Anaerolineae bacterium]
MVWATFRPQAPADDPLWGFALASADGEVRPFARELGALAVLHYTGPGRYDATLSAATWLGDWRFSPLGADVGKTGDTAEIPFTGTRIDLHLRPGDYWATLYATVDGAPANALPKTADGRAYIVLYDPANRPATVTVARHLPDGYHVLRLEAEGGWGQWAIAGWSVLREERRHLPILLLAIPALLLGFALFGSALWWARVVYRWVEKARWLHGKVFALGMAVGVAFFLWRGPAWLPLAGLALLAVCSIVRRDIALGAVAASLPFYQVYGSVLGRHASLTLALLATAVIAAVVDGYLVWVVEGSLGRRVYGLRYTWKRVQDRFAGWWRNLDAMDFAFVALVVVGGLSVATAQRADVALREWIQVILAAAAFYSLIHAQKGIRPAWILVDWLTAGAVAVSLLAIGQFITGSGVITAEGVLRVRGVYGSPNNLALFLGRTFPLALCLAAFGRRKRIAYGLAAVPQLAALFLTFSRGALLLGLPAALLFVGIVKRGRTLWAMLASAVALVASLIPLAGTQRVASLLQTGQGTTFLRLNLWRSAWNMIREYPWRGVGLDNFLYAYRSRFILPAAWEERNLSHPHNFILDWWTRLGVPGLVVLAWLLGVFFATAARLYQTRPDRTVRALMLGLAASMVAALAHGLVDNMFFLTDLALVFALTLGVVGLVRREKGA